jgi:PAS domain S-box-containing protein
MLGWIRRFIAPPVFEDDVDKTRVAWLLNIILLTLIARAIFIRFVTGSEPSRPSLVVPFVLALLAIMFVMHKGAVRLASAATVCVFWLSLSQAASETGGLHSIGFRNYILPVIMAGLLLGRRAAIVTAAASILAGIGMWLAERNGLIQYSADTARPFELLITHAISLMMAAVLVTLATRSIEQGLERARREIAERRQAEHEARVSEERFSKAFNLSPLRMGILKVRNGEMVAINDCFINDMGFSREEIIGRSIFDIRAWSGAEVVRIRQLLQAGKAIRNWEALAGTKSGEWRTTLVSAEPIEISGEACMLFVSNDITELKRSGEALRESEELFRTSFENATVGVCLVGIDGRFFSVNPTLCEMLGYKKEELEQLSFNDITVEEDKHLGTNFVSRAINGDIYRANFEKRYVHKDGRIVWAYVSTALVPQPVKGRRRFFISYIQDITERKQAEEQLKAKSEQLRALTISVRSAREAEGIRIAREIHDELGSALTSLKWDLEEMGKVVSRTDDISLSSPLRMKIAGMSSLVDSTIDAVRRISAELRPSILDDLGLAAAVEWQAEQFQARTGIQCNYEGLPGQIELDPERSTAVFRIFQEALTNVLRHAQATRIEVSLDERDDEVVLRVQDNGRGILESESTGFRSLGLLGMRERAELIGGSLEIMGVEGVGTTVVLRVPHLRDRDARATA